MGVPDLEVGLVGHLPHALAVGEPEGDDRFLAHTLGETTPPAGHHDAGGQPLHVPLPGPGQCLVEVVAVEDELAFGRTEDAEVGEVGVAADLGVEPERGVAERSDAMTRAAPRKKVNGETSIRP